MDVVKRARFASKQVRAGPAPLASFEDLPSDELESPEDSTDFQLYASSSALEDDSTSQDQFTTPDSMTISSHSSHPVECDSDSQLTLTPGDISSQDEPSFDLRTTSLSSLSKEANVLTGKHKCSAMSLGTIEVPDVQPPSGHQRKSSWTSIFRSQNQNDAKFSDSRHDPTKEKKSSKKKHRNASPKTDEKLKEKGKFLSIFKRKSPKAAGAPPVSPSSVSSITNGSSEVLQSLEEADVETLIVPESFAVAEDKENEVPGVLPINSPKAEVQNDLGKESGDNLDGAQGDKKIVCQQINISTSSCEEEINVKSEQEDTKGVNKEAKNENITAIVEEEDVHESSESELVEEKAAVDEKKEHDHEAENLILNMSEIEDDSIVELISYSTIPKQVNIPSRQQRLEVTVKPIDRPRSTTPINVSSLEAFIHSVSPTSVFNVEKIKLSLPGEQFTGRSRSPKKSSSKSWLDFCESALHSPRMHKSVEKSDDSIDSVECQSKATKDPFLEVDPFSWTAFESKLEADVNCFGDNFIESDLNTNKDQPPLQKETDPYEPFGADFSFSACSCQCHLYGCSLCPIEEPETASSESDLPNAPVANGQCVCKCHLLSASVSDDELLFPSEDLLSCDMKNGLGSKIQN